MENEAIIVESVSVAKKIKSLFPRLHTFSTNGYLLKLDNTHEAVITPLSEESWVIVSDEKIKALTDFLSCREYSVIFVATDMDFDGELIANQVLGVLRKQLPQSVQFKRIYLTALTVDKIASALKSEHAFNYDTAKSVMFRHALDRSIYNDTIANGAIGRNIAPLLNHIKKNQHIKGYVAHCVRLNVYPGYFSLNQPYYDNDEKHKWLSIFSAMPIPRLKIHSILEESTQQSLFDAKTLFINASRYTGNKLSSIWKSLQSMYAEGGISYFRTDSSHFDESFCSEMSDLAHYWGLDIQPPSVSSSSFNLISKSHHGILPLVNVESVLDNELSSELLKLIHFQSFSAIGCQSKKITSQLVLKDSAPENVDWLKLQSSTSQLIWRQEIIKLSSLSLENTYPFFCYGKFIGQWHKPCRVANLEYSDEMIALQFMAQERLCRPSYLANFMDSLPVYCKNGELTSIGESALKNALINYPRLLEPEYVRQLESLIYSQHGLNVSQVRRNMSFR